MPLLPPTLALLSVLFLSSPQPYPLFIFCGLSPLIPVHSHSHHSHFDCRLPRKKIIRGKSQTEGNNEFSVGIPSVSRNKKRSEFCSNYSEAEKKHSEFSFPNPSEWKCLLMPSEWSQRPWDEYRGRESACRGRESVEAVRFLLEAIKVLVKAWRVLECLETVKVNIETMRMFVKSVREQIKSCECWGCRIFAEAIREC